MSLINGLNFDFIPRAADFSGARSQGAGETGAKSGFESVLEKESTPQAAKDFKKKWREQDELNAAQASPLLSNANQPVSVEPEGAATNSVQVFAPAENAPRTGSSPVREAIPAGVKTDEVAGATRRQAMEEFLNSMENELGIKPEKVIEAFSRLDGQALLASPEDTAEEFIANLDLPPAQEPRAAELYMEMLRVIGEVESDEKLSDRAPQIHIDVVSKREQSLREVNRSIDELNAAFALRNRVVGTPMSESERAKFAVERMDAQIAQLMNERRLKAEKNADDQDVTFGLGVLGVTAGTSGASGASVSESVTESTNAVRMMGDENVGGRAMLQESPHDFFAQEGELKGAKKVGSKAADSAGHESLVKEVNTAYADVEAAYMGVASKANGFSLNDVSGENAGTTLAQPPPTAEDEKENIRELVRQAQIALKNGGGEVNVELKPEGLGQVRLRVSLEDGQINVRMLTESDAAKRLLEKGLDELRADLTAQNLKVETMTVDIGRELQNYLEQRNEEQAREQARQAMIDLMGQFREERNAFRQNFMENTGWRQYRQGRNLSLNPEPVEAAGVSGYRARSASSGRLDLVA